MEALTGVTIPHVVSPPVVPFSSDALQQKWRALNGRYFKWRLQPIAILWSTRLTASVGMFVSRGGPRAPLADLPGSFHDRRVIRLSLPLLQHQSEAEIVGTLAHEMIHQWQFDVLRRRPDHGAEFSRLMTLMNRDGLGITVRHALDRLVQALTKYTWQCTECGRKYHRQRRTIRPRRHRCGDCLGRLRELSTLSPAAVVASPIRPSSATQSSVATEAGNAFSFGQMCLPFAMPSVTG